VAGVPAIIRVNPVVSFFVTKGAGAVIPKDFQEFPMERCPFFEEHNSFTLENVDGHFAYRNNAALGKTAQQFEKEAVDREQLAFFGPQKFAEMKAQGLA